MGLLQGITAVVGGGSIQLHLGIDLVLQIDLLLQQLLKELLGVVAVGRGGGGILVVLLLSAETSRGRRRLGGIRRILGRKEVGSSRL